MLSAKMQFPIHEPSILGIRSIVDHPVGKQALIECHFEASDAKSGTPDL
jgi:hypothetical protein